MNLLEKKHTLEDLIALYNNSETIDKEIFSEMRSNILLASGNHYARRTERAFRQIRESRDISDPQKVKLTKNHTQNIVRHYTTSILSQAPWVSPKAQNEKELQDQKSAELNKAVWDTAKDRSYLEEKTAQWCHDFVTVGEVASKLFFDRNSGYIKSYQPLLGEDGQPELDEMGQLQKGKPVFSGEIIFETIYGFNLLRDPSTEEMRKSIYLCLRKMVPTDVAKSKYPDAKKTISSSSNETYVIFDTLKGAYRTANDEVFIREFYFRACSLYPEGYYYIISPTEILEEGPLPGGIFPICFEPYETFQTAPRGRSPIRHARPYQVEINRSASKMAEHQITLGDDKILLQHGAKVSQGVSLPGVRTAYYTGTPPIVMPGRDGSQYLAYMNSQIDEMYKALGIDLIWQERDSSSGIDPYSMLFRAASQRRLFNQPVKGFERFLKSVCETYLSLAKLYLSDEDVIYSIGKKEAINIQEFKNTQPLCYQIVVEAVSDDVETKLGRQLALNHVLQYVGTQFDKEDLGKLIRLMPYGNNEEALSDLTMDSDNATNEILALDRGKTPVIHSADNHEYHIKRLTNRMRQSDYDYFQDSIKALYEQAVQAHEQFQVAQLQKIKAAESDFIPTTGYLVTCNFYAPKPNNPQLSQLVRLPSGSLQWLIDRLQQQGSTLDQMETMNQQALADIATQYQKQPSEGMNHGNGIPAGSGNSPPGIASSPGIPPGGPYGSGSGGGSGIS